MIEEEDLFLEWAEFHDLYPDVTKEEYELAVKQTQEM